VDHRLPTPHHARTEPGAHYDVTGLRFWDRAVLGNYTVSATVNKDATAPSVFSRSGDHVVLWARRVTEGLIPFCRCGLPVPIDQVHLQFHVAHARGLDNAIRKSKSEGDVISSK
jgi:hypothetical protein